MERVYRVGRLRVGEDVRVIPGALAQNVLLVDLGPAASAVVGTKEAAVGSFDQRPHALGIHGRDSHADAAEHAARQAGRGRSFVPAVAADSGLEKRAAGSAAIHAKELA